MGVKQQQDGLLDMAQTFLRQDAYSGVIAHFQITSFGCSLYCQRMVAPEVYVDAAVASDDVAIVFLARLTAVVAGFPSATDTGVVSRGTKCSTAKVATPYRVLVAIYMSCSAYIAVPADRCPVFDSVRVGVHHDPSHLWAIYRLMCRSHGTPFPLPCNNRSGILYQWTAPDAIRSSIFQSVRAAVIAARAGAPVKRVR